MNEAELFKASQEAGTAALTHIAGVLRALDLFDLSNDTVQRLLANIVATVDAHVARTGAPMVLQHSESNFFVDHELLRLDLQSIERLARLRGLLEALSLNEFELHAGATPASLSTLFLRMLAAVEDHEALASLSDPSETGACLRFTSGIARKGQSMESRRTMAVRLTVTLELFARQFLYEGRSDPAPPTVRIRRVVQGLVDLLETHRDVVLGLAQVGGAETGLAGHLTRTALLTAATAHALRVPQRLVGRAALSVFVGFMPLERLGEKWANAREQALAAAFHEAVDSVMHRGAMRGPAVWRPVLLHELQSALLGRRAAHPGDLSTSIEARAAFVAALYDRLRTGQQPRGGGACSPTTAAARLTQLAESPGPRGPFPDPAMAQVLVSVLGSLPPGSLVKAPSGALGVVRDRPEVLFLTGASGRPRNKPRLHPLEKGVPVVTASPFDIGPALGWEPPEEASAEAGED